MTHYKIDFGFIALLEGGCATHGYIPDAQSSHSGVTIATGFDLGQRKLEDLRRLQLDTQLIEQLRRYLGLTGAQAVKCLANYPLQITAEQAHLIDVAFKAPFISQLAAAYASAGGGPFELLPEPAQTVIASVAFQYGNLASRTPNFWRQVVAQDWPAAQRNLLSFGDRYSRRRQQEAQHLRSLL